MAKRQSSAVTPLWLSPYEAAAYLNCTTRHVRNLQARGKLLGYRMAGGRTIRYKREDVEALLVPIPSTGGGRHAG